MVDDEDTQRRLFNRFLSSRGFQPITASSAYDAVEKARTVRPHLALIDISMPGMDGIKLLRVLRSHPATIAMPVILMTGLSIPESFMEAAAESLKAGPIYAKCQSLVNLEQRIESELRLSVVAADDCLRREGLVVDVKTRRVWVNGYKVHVAGHRLELLCELMRNPGPLSRRALLKAVWPLKDNANIVDVNILRLRRDLASRPDVSIEASSAGYRLVVAAVPAKTVSSV